MYQFVILSKKKKFEPIKSWTRKKRLCWLRSFLTVQFNWPLLRDWLKLTDKQSLRAVTTKPKFKFFFFIPFISKFYKTEKEKTKQFLITFAIVLLSLFNIPIAFLISFCIQCLLLIPPSLPAPKKKKELYCHCCLITQKKSFFYQKYYLSTKNHLLALFFSLKIKSDVCKIPHVSCKLYMNFRKHIHLQSKYVYGTATVDDLTYRAAKNRTKKKNS